MERSISFLYYSFKIFRRFWLAPIPRLILHNQLALTIFSKWTKTNGLHGYIQRRKSYFLTKSERKKYKNTFNISFDEIYLLFEEYLPGETSVLKPCREIGQRFGKTLQGGSLVQNLETFWMINKTIVNLAFVGCEELLMQTSENVIHLGLQPRWITSSSICGIILHNLLSLIQ